MEKRTDEKKKMKKGIRGITLIALIITIVVILILAAVSINLLIGKNGIINRAGDARKQTEEATKNELMGLDSLYASIDNYLNFDSSNNPSGGTGGESKTIKISYDYDKTEGIETATVDLQFEIEGIPTYDEFKEEYLNNKSREELESAAIKPYAGSFDDFLTKNGKTREDLEQMAQEEGITYDELLKKTIEQSGWLEIEYLVATLGGEGKDETGLEELYMKIINYSGDFEDFLLEQNTTREQVKQMAEENGIEYEAFLKLMITQSSNLTVTISNGTTLEVKYNEPTTSFKVNKNGAYTVTVVGANGEEGKTTIDIANLYEEKFSEIYGGTRVYTDANGKTATIPKGFAVGISKGINEIDKGLVITDEIDSEGYSIGNEFVWIPVTYTVAEGSQKDTNELYPEFLEVFYRSDWRENQRANTTTWEKFIEPSPKGYTTPTIESEDYYEMMRCVQENKGFYIGRYEAGSQDESGNPISRTFKANGTSKVVVKRDQYPYTYVGWGYVNDDRLVDYTVDVIQPGVTPDWNQGKGALYLCKHMYDGKDIGAISTLCYGIQWDAMLDFIKDDTHDVTNNKDWGNTKDNLFKITRTTAKYATYDSYFSRANSWTKIPASGKTKVASEIILLTTGADNIFKARNIFDVAGNVWEITNESTIDGFRIMRGGGAPHGNDDETSSWRGVSELNNSNSNLGFRPVLYVKCE